MCLRFCAGLDERIRALQSHQAELNQLDVKLAELTEHLLAAPEEEPSSEEALVA